VSSLNEGKKHVQPCTEIWTRKFDLTIGLKNFSRQNVRVNKNSYHYLELLLNIICRKHASSSSDVTNPPIFVKLLKKKISVSCCRKKTINVSFNKKQD